MTESFWVRRKRSWSSRLGALLLAPLHEVQAPGVGRGDLPALGQDQLEQLVDVTLRGEGHPDLVELVQVVALAVEGPLELPDHASAVQRVEGALQAQPDASAGHGVEEDVVEEGEASQNLVGLPGAGHGHDHGLGRASGLQPGFEGGPLRVEAGGVGDDEGAGALVQPLRHLRQGIDLLGGHASRQVPLHDLAELSPDEELRHRSLAVRVAQSNGGRVLEGRGQRADVVDRPVGPLPAEARGIEAPEVAPIVRTPAARPAAMSTPESPTMALSVGAKPVVRE